MTTYSRVSAVGAHGNEAHITVGLATRSVVCADNGKTSVLARGARVWLQRTGVESGDLAQVFFEFLEMLLERKFHR